MLCMLLFNIFPSPQTFDKCKVRKREDKQSVNIFFFLLSRRQNTRWGASNTPFTRWLPAEYQDNIAQAIGWDPERKINGHVLPLVIYFNISSLLAALQMAGKDTWSLHKSFFCYRGVHCLHPVCR